MFYLFQCFYLKKIKDLHGTTSSQHSYVLVIPITIQLQPINQGEEGGLLTSKKKKKATSNKVRDAFKTFQSSCQQNWFILALFPAIYAMQTSSAEKELPIQGIQMRSFAATHSCYSVNPGPHSHPSWVIFTLHASAGTQVAFENDSIERLLGGTSEPLNTLAVS